MFISRKVIYFSCCHHLFTNTRDCSSILSNIYHRLFLWGCVCCRWTWLWTFANIWCSVECVETLHLCIIFCIGVDYKHKINYCADINSERNRFIEFGYFWWYKIHQTYVHISRLYMLFFLPCVILFLFFRSEY